VLPLRDPRPPALLPPAPAAPKDARGRCSLPPLRRCGCGERSSQSCSSKGSAASSARRWGNFLHVVIERGERDPALVVVRMCQQSAGLKRRVRRRTRRRSLPGIRVSGDVARRQARPGFGQRPEEFLLPLDIEVCVPQAGKHADYPSRRGSQFLHPGNPICASTDFAVGPGPLNEGSSNGFLSQAGAPVQLHAG
jgi:hypothetical protein